MRPEIFRKLGHGIVDELADYLDAVDEKPITTYHTQKDLKKILSKHELQNEGQAPQEIFSSAIDLLARYSFHGNHRRQWAYILPTVDPVASLAEFVSGTFNQNVAGWEISPMATEIEDNAFDGLPILSAMDLIAEEFLSVAATLLISHHFCARVRKREIR